MRRIHDEMESGAPTRRTPTPRADQRDQHPGGISPPEAVVESLQRSAGNTAVRRLLARDNALVNGPADGDPLPPGVKAAAERRLGADLGDVRVHGDAAAGAYARSLGGQAVTVGGDIFFRDGTPDASTNRGQKLFLHELTHAAQAEPGDGAEVLGVSDRDSPAEREASRIADLGMTGERAGPRERASAGIAHLQVATEDEQLNGQVPGTTTTSAAPPVPAKQQPATGTRAADSPVLALYDISVTEKIAAAAQAFAQNPPDAKVAFERLTAAHQALIALAPTYEQSDPTLFQALHRNKNYLAALIAMIRPRVGEKFGDDEIRGNIGTAEAGNSTIRTLLH
ncbi:MAG TPA: DUF4157 domain-containing protein [Candidatus Limnocylindrales bacterium]|nr:DUF4157 domain-containing protein [Candidatus Limnocylindrales bacterium]